MDAEALADLVEFARIMVAANDLEPWAELLGEVTRAGAMDDETSLWAVSLYNTYDSLGSAWGVLDRWGSPEAWAVARDGDEAASFPCTQERRGLRGGKVLRRLDSYQAHLRGGTQRAWLEAPLTGDPLRDFPALTAHLRSVWGVGRQSAFEWAEFLAKVNGFAVTAPDAQLWESEGPRRALQRLYGNPTPDQRWLDDRARECRDHLAAEGVELAWEDFETVICDFNVMRDGRYYPGRHLAALREEILEVPEPGRAVLEAAWERIVPAGWADIAPGIDPQLMPVYRDTGAIVVPEGVVL